MKYVAAVVVLMGISCIAPMMAQPDACWEPDPEVFTYIGELTNETKYLCFKPAGNASNIKAISTFNGADAPHRSNPTFSLAGESDLTSYELEFGSIHGAFEEVCWAVACECGTPGYSDCPCNAQWVFTVYQTTLEPADVKEPFFTFWLWNEFAGESNLELEDRTPAGTGTLAEGKCE
eukprot:CAMPEP_0119129094 /NCGR_PEP_ID=MMETSP1310-20130426/6984_1 /TAXON_ID=464262 /ORGANISM="Genus nov. species nov., Strain RCC2339" /LENGTH=176 /DNA_ID=CAMNT_0007119499 /DNA_START=130 /DNA_END=660 /DNA_ORIENTATION=+